MSARPIHADNAAQAEYWSCVAGPEMDRPSGTSRPGSAPRFGSAHRRSEGKARRSRDRRRLRLRRDDNRHRHADKPGGEILGLDISEPMLGRARERAAQSLPIRFELADATVYDFEPQADLIVSRFGVMFFADPARSFANLRKGLKPGGRLAFACWREAKQNPFFIVPLQRSRETCPSPARDDPEAPGPFAFASEERVRRVLTDAGFAGIVLITRRISNSTSQPAAGSKPRSGPRSRSGRQAGCSTARATRFAARRPADIRKALAAQARGDSVPLGAAIWIVTASNPG